MRMYDIIQKKRDGGILTESEIAYFVNGYTTGVIPDYQASALLMAIYFKGMNEQETVALTECMAASGDQLDLSLFEHKTVDKHSTGGVGDKTSLIVAPIVAALGGKVSKMSGRGLGHTGGTVDKLESIPGYQTSLSVEEFLSQVQQHGIALIGQSGNLTPADKKLYALRDVTATVDSIPLITSSIMSKKLAAGSHNIVLDVKYGSGAFMKSPEDAEELAQAMVDIGRKCHRNMTALITNMDVPLGYAVGNALEIKEAVAVLCGKQKGALYEVCVALATRMIALVNGWDDLFAREKVEETISSGAAFEKMKEWVKAQGGDEGYLEDPSLFKESRYQQPVYALRDGYVSTMNAEQIGLVCVTLGAGRKTKEDSIDHSAGILFEKTVGDQVKAGDVLCTLHSNDASVLDDCQRRILEAVRVEDTPPSIAPLIYHVI